MTGHQGQGAPHRLPEPIRSYLVHPCLNELWTAARARLERSSLSVNGTLTLTLDDVGARRLGGLLGTHTQAGSVRVPLAALDAALRASSAGCSLITAVADLTGSRLADRPAERHQRHTAWAAVWARLEDTVEEAGLAGLSWVPNWRQQIRGQGLLTRAGPEAAAEAVEAAVRVLAALSAADWPCRGEPQSGLGLGHLAARTTGDAHGLDDGRLAGALVLRAIAAAYGLPWPQDAPGRRRLWGQAGVSADQVSGTVLVFGLRPPGDQPWPTMLRARADLSLVTHLTLAELTSPPALAAPLIRPGQPVHVCENPQILQAAALLPVPGPLLCTMGMPSTAGWRLLERLCQEGASLRYHGDFDWPGITIAGRLLSRLAQPWRLGAQDYRHALTHLPGASRLPLAGSPAPTPWDTALADAMQHTGIAVHEESLLPLLLDDLRNCPASHVA